MDSTEVAESGTCDPSPLPSTPSHHVISEPLTASHKSSPKYHINQLVTPRTIIPTMYFRVHSIEYDATEQTHNYTIRTVPLFGDHLQPDITRVVSEEELQSREERLRRHYRPPPKGKGNVGLSEYDDDEEDTDEGTDEEELMETTNRWGLGRDMSRVIEVGDLVNVRMNSRGVEWAIGTVVGTNAQEGLWSCWLVELEDDSEIYGDDGVEKGLMPCTQRLVKLLMKGNASKKKKLLAKYGSKNVGAEGDIVRMTKPVFARTQTGSQRFERLRLEDDV